MIWAGTTAGHDLDLVSAAGQKPRCGHADAAGADDYV
jgi:hypothetical protein